MRQLKCLGLELLALVLPKNRTLTELNIMDCGLYNTKSSKQANAVAAVDTMLEANATLERVWICEGWMITRYIRYADPENDWLPYNAEIGEEQNVYDCGSKNHRNQRNGINNEECTGKVVEACTGTVGLSGRSAMPEK